jgi:hypothetical protein
MTGQREPGDGAAGHAEDLLGRREFLGLTAALGAAAVGMAACGPAGRAPAAATATPAARAGLPTADEMMSWIRQIVAQGVRRPGYAADTWVQGFIAEKFRAFGLVDVHTEPVPVTRWDPSTATLVATPSGAEPRTLECFPMPYSAPVRGLDVELTAFDPTNPGPVARRAALWEAKLAALAPALPASFGSAPKDLSRRVYDPENTFAGERRSSHWPRDSTRWVARW